ncbi:hypothetical protein [Halalkalibacter akibai]|uniref:Lipoprotein n=1 Tax=Halalkalibacter akibai (strain ATCC 43226 / DSM 21942 / CIP 109018 / JCM 9157 / 1139) TaxID=1236973 RepID=W4R0N8_HALA3|nr:hypothetical protein [Halalkalibacter akibai]GAE37458.1 hypothetical protein JCM9157_4759 [Halalkalibacter akibai JCM 9157]
MKISIYFFLFAFLLLSGCSNSTNGTFNKLEEKIENELGVKAIILDEPFEVLSVVKQNPPFKGGMKSVRISYGIRDEVELRLNSKEDIKRWEASTNSELWHEFYNGELRIQLDILTTSLSSPNVEKVINIQGYDVEIVSQELDSGKTALFANVNLEEGSYSCLFILDNKFNEDEVKHWLSKLLNQVKEKQ